MEATRGGVRRRSPEREEDTGMKAAGAMARFADPALLAAYGLLGGTPAAVSVALVWFAHIAMDRLLGYGLKNPTGFTDTHLGGL
jgi:hypothetical protein